MAKEWLAAVAITLVVMVVFVMILRWTRYRDRGRSGCSCHESESRGTCSGSSERGGTAADCHVPEGLEY